MSAAHVSHISTNGAGERRCFFLGAGFSRCCELPLARELTYLVFRSLWRADPTDESRGAPMLPASEVGHEVMVEQLQLIRALFPASKCDPERPDSWPDFEELIAALDEADQYQSAFERIWTSPKNPRLAANTKSALIKGLESLICELSRLAPTTGRNLLERFVRTLRTTDTVVSFNWDALLEQAADAVGITWDYWRSNWKDCLAIARPHGAVNVAEVSDSVYESFTRASNWRPLEQEHLRVGAGEEVLRTVRSKAADAEGAIVGPFSRTSVVEPSTRKRYELPWLDQQWVLSLGRAMSARDWIGIGFSLPKADIRPRLLLQLAQMRRESPPRLVLVDPNAAKLRTHFHEQIGLEASETFDNLEAWVKASEARSGGG